MLNRLFRRDAVNIFLKLVQIGREIKIAKRLLIKDVSHEFNEIIFIVNGNQFIILLR